MVKLKKEFVIGGAVTVVLLAVGFILWVNRNIATITIVNDTSDNVSVTGCGMDPGDVSPSQKTDISTRNMDPGMSCAIYVGGSAQYSGCLLTPTNAQERTYYVSKTDRNIKEMACLDRSR